MADHAEAFGAMQQLLASSPAEIADPRLRRWREQLDAGSEARGRAVREIAAALRGDDPPAGLVDPELVLGSWMRAAALAEQYDESGRFTALVGYEWTSHPNGGENLHRVVIFRDGKERVDRVLPFSAGESEDPEDLWSALAAYESLTGGEALAIPHNGNLSNGRMFAASDFGGRPLTRRQAATRARWEPVVEVTQQKGDSETLWDKTFGGSADDWGSSVRQTADGGYVIAGWNESFSAGGDDIWLIKTDANGNKLWDKTFGGSIGEWGQEVQQTRDGGYVIAGWTESFGAGGDDFWLIKTDAYGNV